MHCQFNHEQIEHERKRIKRRNESKRINDGCDNKTATLDNVVNTPRLTKTRAKKRKKAGNLAEIGVKRKKKQKRNIMRHASHSFTHSLTHSFIHSLPPSTVSLLDHFSVGVYREKVREKVLGACRSSIKRGF